MRLFDLGIIAIVALTLGRMAFTGYYETFVAILKWWIRKRRNREDGST